ncbi:MAG: Smr/MutS family protein [Pseudomonadota bacterium]
MKESSSAPRDVRVNCLDWPDLVARLADQARSSRGRTACEALADVAMLAGDLDQARAMLADVSEVADVIAAGLALPGLAFTDVEPQLDAAENGLVLGADELRPIAGLCETAAEVRRFFVRRGGDSGGEADADADADDGAARGRGPRTPLLAARVEVLEPWERLARTIRATFDPAGQVRDDVSPELARLRRERESLSGRVRGEIERLMQEETFADVMQDQFWTIRQDRYVLPLKASAKSMGLGIVHDSSRTGETVFVEPVAVVALNNRVRLCDLEIEHEIRRVLEALSSDVAAAAPALRANLAILGQVDVIAAKARLGVDYGGSTGALVDDTFVDLRQARHPLLVLRAAQAAFKVVPNDIALGGDAARVLVVSGPNAGGKTVILKTIGLAALMARAGMLLPGAPGSRMGFFHLVLPDIGDRQSVMGDLSTFSAHLSNLAEILRAATGAGTAARSLVLLDELMAGTNPEQGAALARATLEALADVGERVLVVATTHADALKGLAEGDARFRNAGMQYDVDALVPTFRVRTGVPGRSYALDIATRMGLPARVLARARALAGGTTVALEQVIATLEARESALARETERLAQARIELQATTEDQRAARDALDRREHELALHSRAAIEVAVREARDAIRAIVRQAQEAGSARAAEAARATLVETAAAVLRDLPSAPRPRAPALEALRVGARVRVPALGGAEGTVATTPDERGRLKVTVGRVTVDAHVSELGDTARASASTSSESSGVSPPVVRRPDIRRANARAAALAGHGGGAPPHGGPAATSAPEDSLGWAVPSGVNTLDLRGQRADEVRDLVEAYLDRASMEDRSPLFILHGHGTGALKKIVRAYLAASPYVRRWAPGGKGQGGDGVTIVEI